MQRSGFSRRDFLQRLSAAGGAAAVYQGMHALGWLHDPPAYAGPPRLAAPTRSNAHVAVLGAGIAGLVSAYELSRAGYRVTVLEARERPGGRAFTVRRGSLIEERDSRQRVTWDDDPELYFDAGAARLPQHHQGILGYARDLDVRLEVLSNHNLAGWLQTSKAFEGRAQRNQRIRADARGFVAELAAKAVDQAVLADPLSEDDKEKLRGFLKVFGALEPRDGRLVYRGSPRNGYREWPSAGREAGVPHEPLDLRQLWNASFWQRLYDAEESPVQVPTMLRPVGGMSKISEALARVLGHRVHYGAEITRLRRKEAGGGRVEWHDLRTGQNSALDADYVIVTIQPGLLADLDQDFAPQVRQALAAPTGTPLAKVAFQAEHRFWELDDQIYGGISWTDHPITQIWYPSNAIHAEKGILVGAYVFTEGEQFAQYSPAERIELALAGGELIHPGRYRKHVTQGVSVSWRKLKYASGATTHWTEEARQQHYPTLLEADGPYYFAGEYLSYVNGWQEGAVRSAHHAVEKLAVAEAARVKNRGRP